MFVGCVVASHAIAWGCWLPPPSHKTGAFLCSFFPTHLHKFICDRANFQFVKRREIKKKDIFMCVWSGLHCLLLTRFILAKLFIIRPVEWGLCITSNKKRNSFSEDAHCKDRAVCLNVNDQAQLDKIIDMNNEMRCHAIILTAYPSLIVPTGLAANLVKWPSIGHPPVQTGGAASAWFFRMARYMITTSLHAQKQTNIKQIASFMGRDEPQRNVGDLDKIER